MNAKRPAPLREEAKQSFPDTPRDGDSPLLLITSHTVLVDSAFPEIMAAARERNWRVLDLALIENELPHGIVPRLAMIAADALHNRLCNRLKRMGCGVVRVGNAAHRAASGAPAVGDNFAEEGRLAAEHFAERNFRYVAFPVWGEPTLRFEAFRARATELGCTCHPLAIKSWSTREGESWSRFQKRRYWLYFDAFRKWARSVPRPIGLACPTDVLGARYIHMARQLGFRVPHDIAILGRGDMPHICECALVPLSSIRVNFKSHVNTAFRLLDRMLAGEAAPPQPFEVPPGGISRLLFRDHCKNITAHDKKDLPVHSAIFILYVLLADPAGHCLTHRNRDADDLSQLLVMAPGSLPPMNRRVVRHGIAAGSCHAGA